MTNDTTIFIDFDGTICFDYFWRSADSSIREKIKNYLFSEDSALVREWMIGKRSSEDINQILSKECAVSYDDLWRIFIKDCKSMSIRQTTLDLLIAVREHYKTILITDNMDSLDRFTIPSLNLEKYFNTIANSYNYQALKDQDDGTLFELVSDKMNIKLSGSILIDNSEHNCQLFESLGGKAFLVHSPECIEKILINFINSKQQNICSYMVKNCISLML